MKIKFLGAAGTVTGSCYFLTSEAGNSIFIDCGMFQGSMQLENLNYSKFDCDPSAAAGMVLTHAHMDHCGRIPRLFNQGFDGPIYMNNPTREITEITLMDSAKIGVSENGKYALYDKIDVEQALRNIRIVEYHKPFKVGDFSVVMSDAGHILGSTSLEVTDLTSKGEIKKIVFSGDIGNYPQDLIKKTEFISSGDIVVMESTYGDETHPNEDPSQVLQAEINAIERSAGTLLIPAFSIERSQEVLHRIYHLKQFGKIKPETQIFFDGPMGQKVTQIFLGYRELYNDELTADFKSENPFHFPGLTVIESREDSFKIDEVREPKVIIAGSGMMNGGRILGHAAKYLPVPTTRLLMVGYQAEETLGRQILDGERDIVIDKQHIKINGTVSQTRSMSSHADQPRLLSWLKHISGVKKVFLTHGEDKSRQGLSVKIKSDLGISDVVLPVRNQEIDIT